MKYINSTASCFKAVITENDKIVSFYAPFDSIKMTKTDNQAYIDSFVVVTQIDFLGTGNSEHTAENPLEMKRTIDFIIRITKCDQSPEKRIGCDIDRFSINLSDMYEENQINHACFHFFNYTRITSVDNLALPGGEGKYVIKVLIKDSEEEKYTIQSMTQVSVI